MPDRQALAAGPLLVLTPTGRDAEDAASLLGRDGVACEICPDLDALCAAMDEHTGAVLVADEVLVRAGVACLAARMALQPPWSDLPVIILTRSGPAARRTLVELQLPETLGNVVLLERPLNALSLVSAVRSAMRARRRQRQLGEHFAERERAAQRLAASERRLTLTLSNAQIIGLWNWDLRRDLIQAD